MLLKALYLLLLVLLPHTQDKKKATWADKVKRACSKGEARRSRTAAHIRLSQRSTRGWPALLLLPPM